jgi:hypothetical protein
MAELVNGKDLVKRGFHKALCDLCAKPTWHYKEADQHAATCCNHSNYVAGRRKTRVSDNTIIVAHLTKTHPDPPSEKELRIANRMNTHVLAHIDRKKARVALDQPWAKGMFDAAPKMRDPSKTYCTFCRNEVQQIDLTTERKPKISRTQEAYKDATGAVVIQDRIVTQMETLNACPNCCLNIRRPIVVRRV